MCCVACPNGTSCSIVLMQWRLLQFLWWVTVFPKRYTICSAALLRAYAEALYNADCFACLRCTLPAFTLLVTVNRTKTCNCWCRLDLHFDTADISHDVLFRRLLITPAHSGVAGSPWSVLTNPSGRNWDMWLCRYNKSQCRSV